MEEARPGAMEAAKAEARAINSRTNATTVADRATGRPIVGSPEEAWPKEECKADQAAVATTTVTKPAISAV